MNTSISKFAAGKKVKTTLVYGLLLAAGTFLLQWMEYQYLLRQHSVEFTIVILCIVFTALGTWFGLKLNTNKSKQFETNNNAKAKLKISNREMQVLSLLAEGNNTQEISNKLFISTNTVKTHLKRLYEKLEASHRGQAVQRAQQLGLVP